MKIKRPMIAASDTVMAGTLAAILQVADE